MNLLITKGNDMFYIYMNMFEKK